MKIFWIKSSSLKISLQLDESTDETNCSQLIALVRYVNDGAAIREEFLFCKELKATKQEKEVYQLVKDFFPEQNLNIKTIGSVCTDGAPAMLGNRSGFSALMKREIPHLQVTYCFLHRHALTAKALPPNLKEVLSTYAKTIKWIWSRAVNHRFAVTWETNIQFCSSTWKSVGFH